MVRNEVSIIKEARPVSKPFEEKTETPATKLKDKVKVKQMDDDIKFIGDKIELKKGEYVKLLGATSVDRVPLYCSNVKYTFFLELTNNLDYIAKSILGGELDKMSLISEEGGEEKCQFFVENNIIYIVYGIFPDKKGKWILEQMSNHFSELVLDKNINQLTNLEKHDIELKFDSITKFILKEYVKLQEVFSDQEIPYVEDKIRIDYFGLSSKSIGVISLLLGEKLNVEILGTFDNPEDVREMKESTLTAKIEAIAANTQGNTDAVPRWIAVKLGFQNYRFLTFKRYQNNFYLYMLSEGNLGKIEKVEALLEPLISEVIASPFSGNLRPFNDIKMTLNETFKQGQVFY